MKTALATDGYALFDHDPLIAKWSTAAHSLADDALRDQSLLDQWLRCEGTWFVGVDALATGPKGEAAGVELKGDVIDALSGYLPATTPMHRAQLSVVYPGYPKPREGESEGAFRYRVKRDAAHVDGLHATGVDRRRHLNEHHAYLLGLPLTDCGPNASPLVVWRGSQRLVQNWLRDALKGVPPDAWFEVDLTEGYQKIRREIFETCDRVELFRKPGEAVVLHRHVLHGIAPWRNDAPVNTQGRMIAYFRPEVSGDLSQWLHYD